MKKPSLKAAKARAWKAFAAWIKLRDGGECYSCGKRGLTGADRQAGHLIPSHQSSVLRYDPENVHVQCSRCNIFEGGNLHQYRERYIAREGQVAWDNLWSRHRELRQYRVPDYLEIEQKYLELARGQVASFLQFPKAG